MWNTPTWRPRSRARPTAPQGRDRGIAGRFAEDVLTLGASHRELFHRLLGADMHHIQRCAGQVGDHDRAVVASSSICGRNPVVVRQVFPAEYNCSARTSIAGPFSACIIVSSPVSADFCIALRICASSE